MGFGPWPCQIPEELLELVVVEQRGEGTGALGKPRPGDGAESNAESGTRTAQNRDTASLMSMQIIRGDREGTKIKAGIVQRW